MEKKGVTLYFMRHGETVFNRYNRMQGWSDMPLTKEGRLDAIRSGLGLRDIPFDAVYTSDLRRTIETAQLVLRDHPNRDQLTLQMMPEFREVYFGSLEGGDANDIWEKLSLELNITFGNINGRDVIRELNMLKEIDPDHIGEDYMEFWLRVEQGLLKIIAEHRDSNRNILIVSHGMAIRNILHALLADFALDHPIYNGSISAVEYSNGAYHLKTLNDTSHFAHRNEAVEKPFTLLPMVLKTL